MQSQKRLFNKKPNLPENKIQTKSDEILFPDIYLGNKPSLFINTSQSDLLD